MTDAQRMAHAFANDQRITRNQLRTVANVSERDARKFIESRRRARNFTKLVKITDCHYPYQDQAAVDCSIAFCEKIQPEIIVLDEVHDFYELSRFNKDPERKFNLQDEIDQASGDLFARLRFSCPSARIILLNSNHLARLKRFLWTEGSPLSSLRALEITKLLELDKYGIEFMEEFFFKDTLFKHGSVVRKHSCYTARAEHDREGTSGSSGHTHRAGMYFVTKRGGEYVWVEGGCHCRLDPEYIEGVADWQHAVTLFTYENDGRQFFPQIIKQIKGKMIYGDEIITACR